MGRYGYLLRKMRWSPLLIGVAALAGVGVSLSVAVRAADDDGWYTPDQAAHGHITFNSYCAQCHRPDLQGAMGPALVGDAFIKTWANRPLSDLFNFEHTKMPENNPGAVPEDKLWNITAYILQKNGFAPGSAPLGAQESGRMLVAPQATNTAQGASGHKSVGQ